MDTTKQARFVIGNVHDSATLTATSAALAVENTQRSERALVWRSADLQQQVIDGVLPTGAVVSCIALVRHNLGSSGLRRIQLFNGSEPVYDSGPIPTALLIPAGIWRAGIDPWGATYNDQLPGAMPATVLWLPTAYVTTHYRITLDDPDNPDGFMEVGRILIGDTFTPQFNFSWSPRATWQESGVHKITEGGSLRTIGIGDQRRRIEINLDWLIDTDRTQLISRLARVGMGSDVLISLYPNSDSTFLELEGMMICRREQPLTTTHNLPGNWQMPIAFLEV